MALEESLLLFLQGEVDQAIGLLDIAHVALVDGVLAELVLARAANLDLLMHLLCLSVAPHQFEIFRRRVRLAFQGVQADGPT